MESQVSLGGKEDRTITQFLAEPGIELGTLCSESRDLTNCANHAPPKGILYDQTRIKKNYTQRFLWVTKGQYISYQIRSFEFFPRFLKKKTLVGNGFIIAIRLTIASKHRIHNIE